VIVLSVANNSQFLWINIVCAFFSITGTDQMTPQYWSNV